MKHLSGNGKQQVIADGNPYLRVYCILAGSVECLDVQMLFDPFEETFHLPTFPIKFSNGQVRMCEVIGQEPIDISRGIILIHNHTECIRIPSGGFQSRQPDSGIANNSGAFINRMLFHHLILHVVLSPGDEESPLAMKVEEQLLEIHISLVHEVIITRLYGHEAHGFGVMDRGFRQINKCGNRSPQIQQGMHLYTTFIMMKPCPWTELQAKFHRTAVEGKDDSVHVESGRLFAVQVSRLCNQYLTEVVIDPPILGSVNMCQSRALDIFDSGSIQLGGQGNQRCINAAQAILTGELGKTHHHELVSAFELDGRSVAIVSLYAFIKLISRYERHYLSEYGLSLIHDFYLLQYYLQKYKFKSRKNFIRVMH